MRNILFIMCDQLRWDYLSCYGHQSLQTPNIDALAARGVRFTNAYVQSPVCGPSRMSFYTGRYMSSHGATTNFMPLKVGEHNLGDHLKPLGVRPVLVGKTHMMADEEGMRRLGIAPDSRIGVHHREAGFEVIERDDGIHPDQFVDPNNRYNTYLRGRGYDESNPWHWAANAVDTENGVRSGYFNDIAHLPARVSDEEAETPYMTRRAIEFLDNDDGTKPWLLHLSFIKPHWPYIAPAPYNDMYGPQDVQAPIRSEGELEAPNPLLKHFMDRTSGRTFSRDEARDRVIPAYMGLIKQIDDQLGILFTYMEDKGLLDETMIVFTSDHGDYLGDHWMGDKDYFHDQSVKVPLIIADPEPEMDGTRGSTCDDIVEAIDLLPTFIDFFGGEVPTHIIDGRSLRPYLRSEPIQAKQAAISEYDYSIQLFSEDTGRMPLESRSYMVATQDWKYIHAPGFPPVLFDLNQDPLELQDLGQSETHKDIRRDLHGLLADWSLQYRQRTTWSEETVRKMSGIEDQLGVLIGYWDEDDVKGNARIPIRPSDPTKKTDPH